MQQAGVSDIKDLARQVPSLQVQTNTSPLAMNYRIRRVGNIGNIPTFEPAVGVFQDGAFRNRPVFSAGDMFDVDRIEILRGPQSTLYGKNTTAGVVAVYTRKPAEEFEGSAELTAGNLEGASDAALYRFVGGVSGPLTDTLGGSLGLSYSTNDHVSESALSVSDEDANDLERGAVRGQLQWEPTDALSVRLIGGVLQQDDDQYTSDLYIEPGSGAAQAGAVLRQFGLAESCASNDPTDLEHCSRNAVTSDVDAREATLLVDYALANEWTITSISSWDWFEFKGTSDDVAQLAAPLLKLHDTQEGESWQQELRLASAGGETVDWLGGVFWYQNEFDRGDGGDRPIFLEDTYSAHPVPSLLLQRLFGTPFPVPFATPGQNGLLDAQPGYRLRRRLRPGDLEHHGPLRGDRRCTLADRGEGRTYLPVAHGAGAEPAVGTPDGSRGQRRDGPRHRRGDLVAHATVRAQRRREPVRHRLARLQVRRLQRRLGCHAGQPARVR